MIAENNLESHGTWEAYNKGYVDLDFVVPKDKPQSVSYTHLDVYTRQGHRSTDRAYG